MNTHRTLVSALAIGLLSLSGVAMAAPPDFAEVDANGDGMISKQEAGELGFSIANADSNGDGRLSREEFEAATQG